MLQRATDLAMLALIGVAAMVAVQATWTPPAVSPADAQAYVGQTVRMEGQVLETRWFDDAVRFVLVADGAAVHVRAEGDVQEDAWVRLTGDIRRDGGVPVLYAHDLEVRRPPPQDRISLTSIAADPDTYIDHLVSVPGHVDRGRLHDAGHELRLAGGIPEDGAALLRGTFVYSPPCTCHVLHVAEALPWSP